MPWPKMDKGNKNIGQYLSFEAWEVEVEKFRVSSMIAR